MKKIHMKNLIAKHFQFGMTMDGGLPVNEKSHVVFSINPIRLTLMFDCKFRIHWEHVKQEILLDWLSPHYGSKQVYFLCPVCGKRVLILYNSVRAYVCWKCDKLANKDKDDWEAQSHLLHPVCF